MKVWIEQEYCTGDGLCEDICRGVFQLGDDGLAHVREDGHDAVDGQPWAIEVSRDFGAGVLDAQAQCPGECIYVKLA